MLLYALAAAGIAARGLLFARVGIVGAALVGHLAAASVARTETVVSKSYTPARMPGDAERPARRVPRLAAELSYYLDRDSRGFTADDIGGLGTLLIGHA